ncbi:hypothetical protein ILUMI_12670 [Ignelater luminosus]|uniref:Uncharacterized protein n=1 Tax=Ignelater luminosus TaxID=2038154 RepID=A0A8K0G9C5_IGNLU|nr:hypothetical protein ILUMI_12670 [Ignelater luminosus]
MYISDRLERLTKRLVKEQGVFPEVNKKKGTDKFIYFSDGTSSQYKNKKNFVNITDHEKDFDIEGESHFFGSCHGKNTGDGVGGTTKREMFHFCKQHIQGITNCLVKKEEIDHHDEKVAKEFNRCRRIVGTRQFHRFHDIAANKIRCYFASESNKFEDHLTA